MNSAEMFREGGDRAFRNHLQQKCIVPLQAVGPATYLKVNNQEMFLYRTRKGKINGAENEERDIQRLPYLGIYPVYRPHTLPCCCGQETLADTNLMWLILGNSAQQLTNADVDPRKQDLTEIENPNWTLAEGLEEQRGLQPHKKNNIGCSDHPLLTETRGQIKE